MTIDIKVLALANLIVQSLLMAVLALAAYNSIIKGNFTKHCAILRIAVPVQLLAVALIMSPSMLGYLSNEHKGTLFNAEILIHHTLGEIVIVVWLYANLVLLKVIKPWIKLVSVMRLAFASWITAYLIGVYLYVTIYGF